MERGEDVEGFARREGVEGGDGGGGHSWFGVGGEGGERKARYGEGVITSR